MIGGLPPRLFRLRFGLRRSTQNELLKAPRRFPRPEVGGEADDRDRFGDFAGRLTVQFDPRPPNRVRVPVPNLVEFGHQPRRRL